MVPLLEILRIAPNRSAATMLRVMQLAALIAACVLVWQTLDTYQHAHTTTGDFYMFYNAAQRDWTAANIYRLGEADAYMAGETARYAPFIYAPHYLLMLAPMRGMDPYLAEFLWLSMHALLLMAVLLSGPVRRMVTALEEELQGTVLGADRFVQLALIWLLPAAIYVQLIGHPVLSATAGLLLAVAWLTTRPALAGIIFGLLAYKLQLVLLVPVLLLAGKYWRAMAAFGATLVALFLLAFWQLGPDVWSQYVALLTSHAHVMHEKHGQGIIKLFVSSYASVRRLGGPEWLALGLQAATALLAAYGVARAAITRNQAAIFIMLAGGMVLASPYIYLYDMVPAMLAVAMLAYRFLVNPRDKQKAWLMLYVIAWPLLTWARGVQFGIDGMILVLLLWVLCMEWIQCLPTRIALLRPNDSFLKKDSAALTEN